MHYFSAGILTELFVGYDRDLYAMTVEGLRIFSFAFLLMGYNIYASAFFTALNDGATSAIISVARTLVIQLIVMYTLPLFFGLQGLWLVVVAVEVLGLGVSAFYLKKYRKVYGYW